MAPLSNYGKLQKVINDYQTYNNQKGTDQAFINKYNTTNLINHIDWLIDRASKLESLEKTHDDTYHIALELLDDMTRSELVKHESKLLNIIKLLKRR